MKPGILAFISSCFIAFTSQASPQQAIITWRGDAGYRANITMSYDDAFASVGASGGGSPGGTPTNQGITQLSVAFFSPSLQPLFATNDIFNGVINYKFLSISFDTSAHTLLGFLDVGKDTFAEGGPGPFTPEYYLTYQAGVVLPMLHDAVLLQTVDSGGQFTVTIVPEPSMYSLCMTAVAACILIRSRRIRPRTVNRAAARG
jgi:hypothetical protein